MDIIYDLTLNQMDNPLGIGDAVPQFCWKVHSDHRNFKQTAYQIRVWERNTHRILWDSGKVISEKSNFIFYEGTKLHSRQFCEWAVRIWNSKKQVSEWSGHAFFETGLTAPNDWTGRWVEPVQDEVQKEPAFNMQSQLEKHEETTVEERLNPCQFCRKTFYVEKNILRARLYATAHGVYELYLNGRRVGNSELAPGFTSYPKFLQYQTYDVTELLQREENVIGVILADGWYAGRIGMTGDSAQYGNKLGFLLQLEIDYCDGDSLKIVSDESFVSSTAEILYSDLYIGEKIDYRLQKAGWSTVQFNAEQWAPVKYADYGYDNLVAQIGEPVRVVDTLDAVSVKITPKGETVIDFGQVVAGHVRLEASGKSGTEIVLEHSEVLDENGNFLNNIVGRNKDQRDIFILKGGEKEILEPKFTFHGFRYVKVNGYPGELKKECAKAVLISSDLKRTGNFECSDSRVNRLQKNIYYSQTGNMISIPTDCPQRERAGWTGDIQIFAPTACWNKEMYSFLNRWMYNVRLEQYKNGGIPNIVPFIPSYNLFSEGKQMPASAGWGDAVVIVPWVLYEQYGNVETLRENYQAMKKWVEYIRISAEEGCPDQVDRDDPERVERQKYLWNTGQNLGDWLIPSLVADGSVENMLKCSYMTQEYISTCFYVYSAELLSKAADVLGYSEDKKKYSGLAEKVRKAFSDEYVDEDGKIVDFQGVYVMALQFNMIAPEKKIKAVKQLVDLIVRNGYCLDTGFVSTPFLLNVLCENGHQNLAYKLFFQKKCPSWLYEVEHGATSIWESWNAIRPDGKILPVSYNHYAFGCVGKWMYSYLGGISALEPGYKKILIQPHMDCGLSYVREEYESVYGLIRSEWKIDGENIYVDVTVPENTSAKIILSNARADSIKESGIRLNTIPEIHVYKNEGNTVCETGSGTYCFCYQMNK